MTFRPWHRQSDPSVSSSARGGSNLLLLALVAAVAWLYVRPPAAVPSGEPRVVAARGALAPDEQATTALFEAVSPSVVFISTTGSAVDFWTRNEFEVPRGTGTGFVWDEAGHIVTNYHVIAGATSAEVRLADQRRFSARLVGASPDHDLAVLSIEVPDKAPPKIALGTSRDLKVGQSVFAIGNPFGLDQSLTTGIISALDRSIPGEGGREIHHLIQTDAAINPGNSGGPLTDSAGRLIGVNTAIFSPSGAYAGVGFAVPADTVNRVVPQLIAKGRYFRPALGITANDELSARVGAAMQITGLLVLEVQPGSPAERAGLRGSQFQPEGGLIPGDFITAVDGRTIETLDDLLAIIDEKKGGEQVRLAISRKGKAGVLTARLESDAAP
ncbi:2-alkenal reductase [Solimonas fluminis]|uniref:2-alkenal reductase n=1 Tax=Solimonas fluminis TaxID=2086571 RepID=A0A2S5TGB5_9GAMM|nr:trypsin-like peptidase domain-containing protein [Solimonas fluminis]PPE74030.1 2-alkenal reductase [Solimonas fluminis]